MSCPITGENQCKCLYDRTLISLPEVDIQSTMRKLFEDHANYTAFVIKSIVDHGKDTSDLLPRLLDNQKEIGNQLKPYIGQTKGNRLTKVLTDHIKLAGDVIQAATNNSSQLESAKAKLFKNSNDVAMTLTSINPEMLPYEETQEMFKVHNEFVIRMTVARLQKKYKEEIKLYDAYINEILMMSDMITSAL